VIAKAKAKLLEVGQFFNDVIAELKKSAWPARPELVESTIVVIISVVVLGATVGLYDQILMQLIRLLSQLRA